MITGTVTITKNLEAVEDVTGTVSAPKNNGKGTGNIMLR